MPKIYKYHKIVDKYTTYTVVDNGEEDKKITELCTIDGDTYISIPDDVKLPKQPKEIILKSVTMTDDLKEQIEKESPHIRLIKKRVRDKIKEKYSIEDELKIIRNKINGIDVEKYSEYNSYVEGCIAEGKSEKEILIASTLEPIK